MELEYEDGQSLIFYYYYSVAYQHAGRSLGSSESRTCNVFEPLQILKYVPKYLIQKST